MKMNLNNVAIIKTTLGTFVTLSDDGANLHNVNIKGSPFIN
jgi:hypothetical protein